MNRCTDCGVPAPRLYLGRCILCADAKYETAPAPVSLDAGEGSFDDNSDIELDPLNPQGRWATPEFLLGRQ